MYTKLTFFTLFTLFIVCSDVAPARASVGGRQLFAWNDKARIEPYGEMYVITHAWSTPWVVTVVQTAVGRYRVIFGGQHEARDVLQTQVVAYGDDNVRCNFFRRSQPQLLPGAATSGVERFTEAIVGCHTPQGQPANSQFVVSLSARCGDGVTTPALAGEGAFFETDTSGTQITRVWGPVHPNVTHPLKLYTSSGKTPRITRLQKGFYDIVLPGLGTASPGVVEVTAISELSAHCKATRPIATGTRGADLGFQISCFEGSVAIDSSYIVSYDRWATRKNQTHQGARAFANVPESPLSYTPQRSWNSGSSLDGGNGTNTAGRIGAGWYTLKHSQLAPRNSAVYVAASGIGSSYCKVAKWYGEDGEDHDVIVETRCFDSRGWPSDTPYVETYQGPIRPD